MSCQNRVLNVDGDDICECGDEGRRCEACEDAEMRAHAYLANVPRSYVTGVMDESEIQDLIDAGRGHLVLR